MNRGPGPELSWAKNQPAFQNISRLAPLPFSSSLASPFLACLSPWPVNMLKLFPVTQQLLPSVFKFSSFHTQNICNRKLFEIFNCPFSSYNFFLFGCVLPYFGDVGCFLKSEPLCGLLKAWVHRQVPVGFLGDTCKARLQGELLQNFSLCFR